MKSFTLIEILVSVALILILGAVVIVNPNRAYEQYRFLNASEELAANAQKAQGFAIGAKEFNGAVPDGGWGIYIEKSKNCYIIFADIDSDKTYDPAGESSDICNASLNDPISERFERVFLPQTVGVTDLKINGSSIIVPLNIVFKPPHPDIFANSATKISNIALSSIPLGLVKTVTVNTVGKVSIN